MNARKPVIGVIPYEHTDGTGIHVPEGYLNGIIEAGGEPRVVNYVDFPFETLDALADELDGIVFTGGRDVAPARYGEEPWPELGEVRPARDALEIPLTLAMYARKKPILGICRGCQVVNVALGGSLIQHVPKVYGTVHDQDRNGPAFSHDVDIAPGSRVAAIFGATEIRTNSYHHQSADRVAPALVISARARDGVIEALECPGDQFVVCLQWHPEKTLGLDEYSIKPFQALLAAAGESR
jgi:putative glutamine amidotransferase